MNPKILPDYFPSPKKSSRKNTPQTVLPPEVINNKINKFTSTLCSFLLLYIILIIYVPLNLPPSYLPDISSQIICFLFSIFLLYKHNKTNTEKSSLYIQYSMYTIFYLSIIKILIASLLCKENKEMPIGLVNLLVFTGSCISIIIFRFHIVFCITVNVIPLAIIIWMHVKFNDFTDEFSYNFIVEYSLCIIEPIFCIIFRYDYTKVKDRLLNKEEKYKSFYNFFNDIANESTTPFVVYYNKHYYLYNKKFKSYLIEFDSSQNNQILSEALLIDNDPNWNELSFSFFRNLLIEIFDPKLSPFTDAFINKNLNDIINEIYENDAMTTKEFLLLGICKTKDERTKYNRKFMVEFRRRESKGKNAETIKWVELFLRESPNDININSLSYSFFKDKKDKANMFSKLVHEFKTPLMCISQLINEVKISKSEDEMIEKINDIENFVNYSLMLVHDIINYFTSSSLSTYQIVKESFRLSEVTNFVFGILKTLLKYNNHKINAIKPLLLDSGDFILTNSDSFRLKQILINFISNSVKFTKSGTIAIKIEKNQMNNVLKISIDDTGCGVPPEVITMINSSSLNCSFPASKNNENQFGSGLGLSISMHVSKLLEWNIGASSELEKGSSFYIEVPLSNVAELDKSERILHNPTTNKRSSQSFLSAVTQKRTLYQLSSALPFTSATLAHRSHCNSGINTNNIILETENSNVNVISVNTSANEDSDEEYEVLVIDDHLLMINSIIFALKQLFTKYQITNYKIIKGYDGADLIKEITKDQTRNKIKLTLIDEDMEFLNGTDAVRIVRKLEEGGKIKKNCICLTSAVNTISPLNEKLFDYFLEKPIKIYELEKLFKAQFEL